jgi:long-chain acyl-CoA synthetase
MQTIPEVLATSARRYPGRTFLDDGVRSLTYAEVEAEVCRLANVLVDAGARVGAPVAIYFPSSIELGVAYHACQRLGAVAMPLSAMNTQRELEEIARRTDVEIMITGERGRDVCVAVSQAVPTLRTVLDLDGCSEHTVNARALMKAASESAPVVDRDIEAVAAVFFTSGTTGAPKGIVQSHKSVYSTIRDMAVYNRFRAGREVVLSVLPMFNNFGATSVMLTTMYSGATLVVHERWNTQRALRDVADYGVTFFAGTPTMLTYLLQEFDPQVHDLSSIRLVVTGGAPVSSELIDACQAQLGLRVRQIYGSTEVCGNVVGEPVDGIRKRGSTGTAVGSTNIVIVDPDYKEVPSGTIGEVVVGGDTVSIGYWRDDVTSAEIFSPQGWRSGDLGYLDDDGYLFIVDRKKDLIICGGYNIYPIEVEGVLFEHPKVGMAAVVGIPDELRGEIPVAFVVVQGEVTESLDAELIAYCRERLAAYKAPRKVKFVDELPQGPSGKILKRELRKTVV